MAPGEDGRHVTFCRNCEAFCGLEVEVKDGKAAAFRTLNALKLARISNNLGDAKSLVTHPSTTTHQRLTPEARAELGISEGFIRFSAGLEHPDDLIEDLHAALEKA